MLNFILNNAHYFVIAFWAIVLASAIFTLIYAKKVGDK